MIATSPMPPSSDFRPIPDWPDYRINAYGVVRSFKTGQWRVRKSRVGKNGYVKVNLSRDATVAHLSVHALVLTTFVGPCPLGMEGCHKDGNRENNRLDNLKWATRIENMQDRDAHGRTACGARNTNSKLTADQVREIRRLHGDGVAIRQLARTYKVDRKAISLLIQGKTWKHVDPTARAAIAEQLEGTGVVAFTAEASDGELRAEIYE